MRGRQHAAILAGHLGQPGRNPLAAGLAKLHIQRPASDPRQWRGCRGKPGAAQSRQCSDKAPAACALHATSQPYTRQSASVASARPIWRKLSACGQIIQRQPLPPSNGSHRCGRDRADASAARWPVRQVGFLIQPAIQYHYFSMCR